MLAKHCVARPSGFCTLLERRDYNLSKRFGFTPRTHGNTHTHGRNTHCLMNQLSMWSGSLSATQSRMRSSVRKGYQYTVALTLSCFLQVYPKGAYGKYTTVLPRRMLMSTLSFTPPFAVSGGHCCCQSSSWSPWLISALWRKISHSHGMHHWWTCKSSSQFARCAASLMVLDSELFIVRIAALFCWHVQSTVSFSRQLCLLPTPTTSKSTTPLTICNRSTFHSSQDLSTSSHQESALCLVWTARPCHGKWMTKQESALTMSWIVSTISSRLVGWVRRWPCWQLYWAE